MKAIIMAAGKGSRISRHIGSIPKSTVCVNGVPIIRTNVESLLERDIEVVVCVGYKKELIEDALSGLNVKYYFNPFFDVTNNIANLWFAQDELTEDTLLLSADLYYPQFFIDRVVQTDKSMSMLVDSSRIYDGDFYFQLNDNGQLENYGPQLPLRSRSCEYVGFTYVKEEMIAAFKERAAERVVSGAFNIYFEDAALSFAVNHEASIDYIDVAGNFWREFDFYEDYQLILEYVRENGADSAEG